MVTVIRYSTKTPTAVDTIRKVRPNPRTHLVSSLRAKSQLVGKLEFGRTKVSRWWYAQRYNIVFLTTLESKDMGKGGGGSEQACVSYPIPLKDGHYELTIFVFETKYHKVNQRVIVGDS